MKKLGVAGVALAALIAAPAIAADMPRPVYKAPPPVVAPFSWTGFYIGVNGGGAWGDSRVTLSPAAIFGAPDIAILTTNGSPHLHPTGFTGGGQAGYNWQSGNLVFGVETDINYLGLKKSTLSPVFPGVATFTTAQVATSIRADWLYTLRGSLGLAANNWLFYATGGLAVGNEKFTQDVHFFASNSDNAGSSNRTKAGWTGGGGVEVAFAPNWSAKFEYLFVDLGSVHFSSINTVAPAATMVHSEHLREHIARVGLNYRFGGPVDAAY
jgi:outer membrane immunogenic protein